MADFTHESWKQQDANNNAPSPNGFPVNILPSQVGNSIRAHRGASKRSFDRSNAMVLSASTGNDYTIMYEENPVSYVKGEVFMFFVNTTNTGAATLRIGNLTPRNVVHNDDGSALGAGALKAGQVAEVMYDGSVFRLTLADRYAAKIAQLESLRTEFALLLRTDFSNLKSATKGVVSTGTVTFNWLDAPVQTVEVAGNVQFAISNMPINPGTGLQINMTYTSGTITFPGIVWCVGGGVQMNTIADAGYQFEANRRYRIHLEMVNGVIQGVLL